MEGRHLIISGRVQGIGFRHATVCAAQRGGATGWVRNRRDGSVEAEVYGPPDVLAIMIAWAHIGPPGARVDHVATEWREGDFVDFVQRSDE